MILILHFFNRINFKYCRHGSIILFSGVMFEASVISFSHVSSSKFDGKHSAYSHCNIGFSRKYGKFCSTLSGVSGDDGGVSKNDEHSHGLLQRYGDNGDLHDF